MDIAGGAITKGSYSGRPLGTKGKTPKNVPYSPPPKPSVVEPGDVAVALGATGTPKTGLAKVQTAELMEQAKKFVKGPLEEYGRAPSGQSLRLNPELALDYADTKIDLATEIVSPTPDEIKGDLTAMIEAISAGQAGGRRQRGGDGGLLELLQNLVSNPNQAEEDIEAGLAIVKATAMVAAEKAGTLAKTAAEKAGINQDSVVQFLVDEYGAPLKKLGYDAGKIFFQLVYQVGIRFPVSTLQFTVSAGASILNITSKIFKFANDSLRSGADYLISDDYAVKVATAAVASTKDVVATSATGVFVLNQLGFLPASAVVAAILFTLQLNLGSGSGRAYLVSSLYAWYQSQDSAGKSAFQSAAKEYAKQAKSAAKKSPAEVKKAATAAAGALASALAKTGKIGENAGKSAFQAVGEAAKKAGDWVDKQSQLPSDAAAAITAVTEGAPAAAAAVVAAEASPEGRSVARVEVPTVAPGAVAAAAPAGPPGRLRRKAPPPSTSASEDESIGGGRRRGKKTRRAPKRRITRRARKYLAAPVFSY